MISFIKRLSGQQTPEQEILRNRLVMGSVSGFGCFFFAFDAIIFTAFFAYLSLNACLYAMQKRKIWKPEERWLAAIILDVLMAFAVMLREPEHMAVFYPFVLWMILGNGFRYGVKWIYIAAFLSAITFGIVVVSTAYWQQNFSLGMALALGLVVIPAYCSTLIRKISHAKEQAEMASKAKSYFLASVSHELRTPLNAIIGYGNHLRQSDMPRGQKEMVEASVLAGEHLLHLIEQLIEVAKTGTGSAQVKRSSFRPTDLLAEIREIMNVRTGEKGLALQIQAEPMADRLINGPVEVIRNILLNLVGNAVKFTEAGSISINGGIVAGDNQHSVVFTVTDTGIGIAKNAIERIFQPFQQADETVLNRFGGTGLGLSICKQLVEQVNGTISVDSNIGQGSTFRIEIPVDIVLSQNSIDGAADDIAIKILSFGRLKPELLASAQSDDSFTVRHVPCRGPDDLVTALGSLDLDEYSVALVSQELATQIGSDSDIWVIFAEAEIAPVLVSDSDTIDFDDMALRTSFASILPPVPNFAQLRSAIRIGSSFSRHFRMPDEDTNPAISIYQPKHVLVADDNRTNRNVLAAILETAGHRVTMATDGDEALETLEKGGFDILLLDVNMPRLNGIETCSMWRQIEGGRSHLPIIGVTADATSETEQNCLNAGMDMRITKPVDARLLLATIEQFCGNQPTQMAADTPTAHNDPFNVVVPITGINRRPAEAIDPAQMDYLLSIGDLSFVQSMIEGFFEDVEQTLGPLRRSVEQNDVCEFRFCAHALKSSGNNMGAKSLANLCDRMEKITEADYSAHRQVYLAKIEQELALVIDELKQTAGQSCRAPIIARSR